MSSPKVPAKKVPAKKVPAAKKEKAPAKEKVARVVANGITRPADGSETGKVWAIADAITAKTKSPATRGDVVEQGQAQGINQSTIATQYQRWRVFNGVPKAAPAPKAPKAPAEKKSVPAKKVPAKKA